ncbi:MAG: hypothetical protein R3A80_06955 [Bdellovibrionota bacterium]
MKRKSIKKDLKKESTKVNAKTVSVLYQNIGGEVYAFAQVGAEVYFGKVPVQSTAQEAVKHLMEKEAA